MANATQGMTVGELMAQLVELSPHDDAAPVVVTRVDAGDRLHVAGVEATEQGILIVVDKG